MQIKSREQIKKIKKTSLRLKKMMKLKLILRQKRKKAGILNP